jgi:hypothetical protein
MFRITALDCQDYSSLCTKEGVTRFPTFRVYPAFPAPAEDYQEDVVDFEKVKKMAAKFISSRVVEIT